MADRSTRPPARTRGDGRFVDLRVGKDGSAGASVRRTAPVSSAYTRTDFPDMDAARRAPSPPEAAQSALVKTMR
jgi:hypothetical protein